MLSILAAYIAPAQYVIPSLICTGLILPICVILIFEKQRKHELENPSHNEEDHH
ncbi:hypothetical protein Solca_3802 [Solitalea canadensis DSM 3403]|uniref:Uncharacterized protein n=1 Tax=Solitalea canadensis (strain ATCC 29591 / DSM 3403 / JCM 21819 / LMG 8368 / NBRC 15130 / NCIMB 12057 / USAM 9D) TaxID=929556 RepID=H8KKY4_SOLCM|nr:hypothetical protein Solca_3802 [Solitalea canadensis DSM 3403]